MCSGAGTARSCAGGQIPTEVPRSSPVPSNNAFKLTRSHWSTGAWRHFVPPCEGLGGPSQLNAMFGGRHSTPGGRREWLRSSGG
jgi:hypothetical protein